ncbi:MAG TPA: Ig-like domain-containing protein [bacterium]|nr:Ig-like domain-containing protein [bacterium]
MTLVVFQPAWAATFSSLPAAPTEEQSAQGTGDINEETTEYLINSLADREYQATWQDKDYQGDDFATGKWHFANRANNLRAYFDESGFEMMPRVIPPNEPAPWNFKYSPLTLQRENDNQSQALNQVTNLLAEDNKIIATRGEGVEEWYLNTPAGLEHGFNLQNRPAGDGPVILKGNITTDLEATLVDNNKITFQQNGKLILSYEKLKVIDNEGTELPVRLELEKEGDSNTYQLNFFFDDTNAVYPIIIDPLLDSSWQAESNQASAQFGRVVDSAGDVNGDNYDDIIVGAYKYDNGQTDEGAVFVWYGSATGLGDNGTTTNADWQAESNQASAQFGHSVASAGDVNGDNYDDIIVGASSYDKGQTNEGAVFVWYGSETGLGESGTPANADWQAESNQATAYLGYSVASAGDVNNDGYDEVIVGAYYYDNVESNEGAVFVFSEPPTPSAFSPASGTTINNTTPTITFSLNKNGDCKCSLTDQAYGEMETDCSGDGTKNISCPVPDLGLDGAKTVYISCKDTMNSADNSETNEHLSYTLDTTPPSVSLYSPANDTTDVSLTTDLELTFDEAVNVDAGNIVIYKSSDDSVIETIDVTSDQVSGSGTAVITINPTTDFSYETKYYIQIDPGALVDAINNSYSGITEATTWTFTTEDVPICPVVAHALTYSAYPTCNPTSCESGYVLSGGVCVSIGGGGYIPLPSLGHGALTEYISMHQTKYIAQIKTQGTNILGYIGSTAVFDILLSKTSKLEEHSLTVLDLDMSNGEIKLLIKPNPIEIKLGRGEMINVDLDNDRLNDFSLVYNNLLVNRVDLTIIQLDSPASQLGAYPENSLLKERGQSAVYLIQENRKRLFFNAEAFLINGYNWKDIQVVDDLSKILTGKVIYAKNSNQTDYQFSQDLKIGMTSEEVRELQRYLNTHGFVVTENGLGSPNNETNFFGQLTKAALIKFQQANKINPAIGYFGPITRAAIN